MEIHSYAEVVLNVIQVEAKYEPYTNQCFDVLKNVVKEALEKHFIQINSIVMDEDSLTFFVNGAFILELLATYLWETVDGQIVVDIAHEIVIRFELK